MDLSLVLLRRTGGFLDRVPPGIPVFDLGFEPDRMHEAYRRLGTIIDTIQPTILHTHLVHAGLVGRQVANWAKIPVTVSTQHNAWHPKDQTPTYRAERLSWKLSHGFIALSSCIRDYLRRGGFNGPISVCPTGVDAREAALPPPPEVASRPYLLSVGHLRDGHKGHDVLIRAFDKVRPEHPNLRLYIVGDGDLRGALLSLIDDLGLAGSVTLLGQRQDVQSFMAGCAIFALASRWEGFGRVLIEAMNAGAPIVATEVEAIPEVVTHHSTGILVPAEDPDALAAAILHILKEPELAHRLREAALNDVRRRFSIANMVKCEFAFYSYLLQRRESYE